MPHPISRAVKLSLEPAHVALETPKRIELSLEARYREKGGIRMPGAPTSPVLTGGGVSLTIHVRRPDSKLASYVLDGTERGVVIHGPAWRRKPWGEGVRILPTSYPIIERADGSRILLSPAKVILPAAAFPRPGTYRVTASASGGSPVTPFHWSSNTVVVSVAQVAANPRMEADAATQSEGDASGDE